MHKLNIQRMHYIELVIVNIGLSVLVFNSEPIHIYSCGVNISDLK